MYKTLDEKLANFQANPASQDFILADAKDADMAFGISAPGRVRDPKTGEERLRTLDEFRHIIREIVEQGLVDIMLMSVSTNDVLCIQERGFDSSYITPAVRANDTTDIWLAGGGAVYGTEPSLPFRSSAIDHAMCGIEGCHAEERWRGADLGLYSITFNNRTLLDREALVAYREFRIEAEQKKFRHFLEVFAPNACEGLSPDAIPRYVNDSIARTLAGVPRNSRPLFLKIPYFGPRSMEELVAYDSSLVVGILGGSAGTTFDAFHQLWEAKKYGARAALYGRMINQSEHQLTFIQHLRWLADGELTDPAEAVRSYHGELEKQNITPHRPLAEDLESMKRGSAYGS